jgi:hypothetical protein
MVFLHQLQGYFLFVLQQLLLPFFLFIYFLLLLLGQLLGDLLLLVSGLLQLLCFQFGLLYLLVGFLSYGFGLLLCLFKLGFRLNKGLLSSMFSLLSRLFGLLCVFNFLIFL